MKSITITENASVPYPFAEKKMIRKDFLRTLRLLKRVSTYLQEFIDVDTPPSSVTHLVQGRKTCRIVMYDYKTLLQQNEMHVVVFHGNQRENLSKEFSKEYFTVDWEVVASMQGSITFLCYASQELSDGNWFNLVLFTEPAGKAHVTSKEKHAHAAYTLAPKKFFWVRLHNGVLLNGIKNYRSLQFTKTNYYHFDDMWFAKRAYA